MFGSAQLIKDSDLFKNETKEYYSKSLEIYRKLGITCVFEVQSTITNFGTFLNENGEYQESVKLIPEAMKICRNYFPANRLLLEKCHEILGMAQVKTGNAKEGIENLHAAFKICEETQNDSGLMALHYYNLILGYKEDSQFEKAQYWGKILLDMELICNGKGSPCIMSLFHQYIQK